MKKYSFLFCLLLSATCFSQTIQDYKDYIKLQVESMPGFPTTTNRVVFGDDLLKVDAEKFTGKHLSDEEHKNLFMFAEDVYLDNNKSTLFFEVTRSCDLRGIRKVSTVKKQNKTNDYYDVIVYLKDGFFCKEWSSPKNEILSITEISASVKSDESTVKKIKRAIIELAKASGAETVLDGDDLFKE